LEYRTDNTTKHKQNNMKKSLLIAAAASMVACGAFAQGTINFLASGSSSPIKFSTDGGATSTKAPTGNPSQVSTYGQLNIGFFFAPNGTALTLAGGLPNFTVAWSQSSLVLHQVTPVPGQVPSTPVTSTVGAAGDTVEMEVVAWTGTATSWAAAVANQSGILLGYTGSSASGGGLGWAQLTGGAGSPPGPAATMVTGAGGFNGLTLSSVPEPSTIALGGLGAAALLALRRRK
jgi:hypothetical protein